MQYPMVKRPNIEHETAFNNRKAPAINSKVDATVTSTDGKLTVPTVKGTARKPKQKEPDQRLVLSEVSRSDQPNFYAFTATE